MNQGPSFKDIQYQFASYIRDPENATPPSDVEARRMKVYSELFYNNVEDFIAGNFPVLRELFSDDDWDQMLRDYFARHRSTTPLFPEMAKEFLKYLENERDNENDYPFLLELAHYEWVEAALSLADEENLALVESDDAPDLLHETPVISSMAWLLSYNYPVQKIASDFIPDSPSLTHLLVYRTSDFEIHFMELNAVTMRLLQIMKESSHLTSEQALLQLAEEIQSDSPEQVIQFGLEILQDLHARKVILGTKKQN